MAGFVEGAQVKVIEAFKADDETAAQLRKGFVGTIESVDEDGDLCVAFLDIPTSCYVFQENIGKLQLVGQAAEPAKAVAKEPPKVTSKEPPKEVAKATAGTTEAAEKTADVMGGGGSKSQPVVAPPVPSYSGPPVAGRKSFTRSVANASPDLLWLCMRTSSSFIRKPTKKMGDGRKFSAEPCNLNAWHCAKYSGLASSEALDVRPVKKGDKESIQLVQGHAKASRHSRPKSMFVKTGISKFTKKGLNQLAREIDAKFYRNGLLSTAVAKYLKVKRSFQKKSRASKSRRACK